MAQPMQTTVPSRKKAEKHLPYWVEPAFTIVALGGFVIYAIWEVFWHNTGTYQNYVSPFFSPGVASWFGFHVLTALYVVWVPFLFRFSCYYYRKEYFRGFFFHPAGCAVAEPNSHKTRVYTGERRFPFNLNNLHRYAWYLAVIVLIFLWKDTVQAFIFKNGFGVGVGSIILLINAVLLTAYTFSCHAFRNMVGGRKDCFSCANGKPSTGYKWWRRVSSWNHFHGGWAWASLFSVWAADLYIRLLIMGVFNDPRLF